MEEVADTAYEKAVEVVTKIVQEEVRNEDALLSLQGLDFLQKLKKMDSTMDMLEEVKNALREDPLLLSDEQLKKLESCNNTDKMYGMRTGITTFLKNVEGFLFPENEE